jgi:hypothetical protein
MPKRRIELGFAEAALLFAALGDETRLALQRLSRGDWRRSRARRQLRDDGQG